ncbi:MAG: sulfurtransferase TusA family protein [Rhodospirillaceae bacterium]|jgi:tRNA 2-thiouridine synthesizing protein A|nr:sulfurtransferase TusA family protein [Rhodospirillaceae bacterium]MBT3627697.1 sulfurtransferase TusA family protein [Rhodospirillaceae bacterium]MBT3928227.1 sulfurtransferase TusA family protein [Rhodospirillaceae bacterium]MBT4425293.1 sulfurtransferase TusA family protein [Rhodospirillaceae bacterium]MBT5039518.1 sulfurtransferase TusA family protein [Rhodospirillaceae bacterium]
MSTTTIDARGSYCPGPLLELIAGLKLISIGDEIEIWSSDQGSVKDIPEWIAKVGHQMGETTEQDGYWSIRIIKSK